MNLALEIIWTVVVALGAIVLFTALAVGSPLHALRRDWLNFVLFMQKGWDDR